MYGKSVSGEMTWRKGRLSGSATVACPRWVQTQGDQGRRLLGELALGKTPDALPAVTFTLTGLGERKTFEETFTDSGGKVLTKTIDYCEGMGRLQFGDRTIEVRTKSLLSFSEKMPDNGKPGVGIETFFTLQGRDLGLLSMADDEIDVRIGMRGTLVKAEPAVGRPK